MPKEGKIDLSEFKEGDWSKEDALPFLIQAGDFLLSRGNGSKHLVGRGGVVPVHESRVAFPDTLVRLRVDPSKIFVEYLSLLWESRAVRDQIEKAARTTAGIYKINQGHIESFIIPVPSLQAQKRIRLELDEKLSEIDRVLSDVNAELTKAEALRQSILKKAFSGQLVPQDPNDEPASVLLERIRAEKAAQAKGGKRAKVTA